MAWNCHAPHCKHAPLIVLRSWRILRSCGLYHSTWPERIFGIYCDCFALWLFFLFALYTFPGSAVFPVGKLIISCCSWKSATGIRCELLFLRFPFTLTVCLHAFSLEKPRKKMQTNFCMQLFAAFIREWMAAREREREREGELKEEREGERMQTKRKFEGKAAKNWAYLQRLPFLIRFAMINNKSL